MKVKKTTLWTTLETVKRRYCIHLNLETNGGNI